MMGLTILNLFQRSSGSQSFHWLKTRSRFLASGEDDRLERRNVWNHWNGHLFRLRK